ncbi:energy-coupling factor ABC transporter ATP-binding protein [Hippea alviniae]|uniref:energy-coupling factor ABC transporter ATP-binding protein n=1 Tax=Hippea alviniae TaxID=1279027 RepID=UPI0003B798B0|nr:ABC transporter ATP-binding protein [Hippea alviniae]
MEYVFTLKKVSYLYNNRFLALEDINLNIEESKCTILLGANGSGKSTLLKIIDALILPSKGEAYAFNKKLTDKLIKSERFNEFFRKKVGFVFQDPDTQLFLPTVKDELAFAPLQLGYSNDKIEKTINRAAEDIGIKHLLDNFPFNLSEGEKKKVAIASIYTLNPDVWILDEPIFSLDPKTQWWVIDFIKQLKEKSKTIIIATHNIKLAKLLADKCIILSPEHRIAEISDASILDNKDILIKNNLIHPMGIL